MKAVFAAVLNMSATGSAVIAAILLARLLLRSAPKKWSYLLWSVAGFRLACPVSFGAAFSAFAPLRKRTFFQDMDRQLSTMELLPLPIGGGSAASPGPDWTAPLTGAAVPVGPGTAAEIPDPMTIAAWVWMAIMISLLLYGVMSYWRTKRGLVTAFHVDGNLWQSEAVRSPFILGVFRPRIYVPLGLEGEELRYALAHERYHLRRGDHLVRLFAYLLLAVHWFNPLCWLAYALCGRDMEMRCDEAVLDALDSGEGIRKAYSRTLLSFAEGRRFPRPSPLAFGEASVKSRIVNALRWKRPRTWVTALAAALCIAVIAACGANPASDGGTSPDGERTPDGETAADGTMDTTGGAGTGDTSAQTGLSENELDRLKVFPDSYAEIMERTDLVIYTPDERLVNGQLWENFWNSIQQGQSADVTVAQFTVEGDPILKSVSYDGNLFHYVEDMSRDKFGGDVRYLRDSYSYFQRLSSDDDVWFVLTDEEFTGFSDFWNWLLDDAGDMRHSYIFLRIRLASEPLEPVYNPPVLMVRGAAVGFYTGFSGYSWQTDNGPEFPPEERISRGSADGFSQRDTSAILDERQTLTITDGSTQTAALSFYVWDYEAASAGVPMEPDNVTVEAWKLNSPDSSTTPVPVDKDAGGYAIHLFDGAWSYRVTAGWDRWDGPERCRGTASYVFIGRLRDWGILLTAKDVTPTGLTLVCTQSGGTPKGELMTGAAYVVENLDDGTIVSVPYLSGEEEIVWTEEGWSVPRSDTVEWAVDWSRIYGELPPGQYRIGKDFMDWVEPGAYEESMIYARFTIPDSGVE